mgnify:CR=1 FL=1
MFQTIRALREAWRVFWRQRDIEVCMSERKRRQRQRLASMTDEQLLRCAIQWGGSVAYPEIRRRGLSIPGRPGQ